jgi:hypothetical protein
MKSLIALILGMVVLTTASCGHYPAPIRSARDIKRASPSENMIVVVRLPLKDWPNLQKFTALEHFRVAEEMAPEITDEHVKALSHLRLQKLRDVSFAGCHQITDAGVQALTNITSIQGLQLIGTGITDRGMLSLATEFPRLRGINVERSRSVTEAGYLSLTNSKTISDVGLALEPFSQDQMEHIISSVPNVTWWTISDPHHKLDEARLRELGGSRKITIQVADENNFVRGITAAQPDGAANRMRLAPVADLCVSLVKPSTHSFTPGLPRIVDFLYLRESINHPDVVYMSFSPHTGIFEDKATGSHIYLEFVEANAKEATKIDYSLEGSDGIIHRWVRKFRDEFGATVNEIG